MKCLVLEIKSEHSKLLFEGTINNIDEMGTIETDLGRLRIVECGAEMFFDISGKLVLKTKTYNASDNGDVEVKVQAVDKQAIIKKEVSR